METISFSAPAHIKDLLRLRAAVHRLSLSAFVRELVLAQVPGPTPAERLFMPSGGHNIERYVHKDDPVPPESATHGTEDTHGPDRPV